MAARGGKSQARRKGGSNAAGLPGWAWLVLGVLLTLLVILALPRVLGDGDSGGFLRPRPNPDAQPQPVTAEDAAVVSEPRGPAASTGKPAAAAGTGENYDFYTLLPGQEVEMTDAQLAAAAREEAARKQRLAQQQAAQTAEPDATPPQAIDTATAAADGAVTNSPSPATPQPARQADATTTATPTSTPAPTSTTVATADGDALLRTPVKDLLGSLDPGQFRQIHRSTIVNLRAIASVTRDDGGRGIVKLKSRQDTLTVSQPFMALFRTM